MENYMFEDKAYLQEWFEDNWEVHIKSYIENNFHPASYDYQKNFMFKYLFFSKKIIEDYNMTNEEKVCKLLHTLSYGSSKIITIIGYRGSGKSCTAFWIFEQLKLLKDEGKFYKDFVYVKRGERPETLPNWIEHIQGIEELTGKNKFIMLDETAIEYNSRDAMKDKNKDFIKRLAVLRHDNNSIVLITQHIMLIDTSLRRLSDILLFKEGSKPQMETKDEEEADLVRSRLMPKNVGEVLVEIKNDFYKFNHEKPKFWDDDKLSKTFANYNPEHTTSQARREKIKAKIETTKEIMQEKYRLKKDLEIAKLEKKKELGFNVRKSAEVKKKPKQNSEDKY